MSDNQEKEKDVNRLQELLARFKGRSLLEKIMLIIALPFVIILEPFRQLYDKTYDTNDGFDAFRKSIGILTALGAGIGNGYSMNAFAQVAAWKTYLLPSLGMAALGFYVLLPLFYLKAWKCDTFLWKLVDRETYEEDGKVKTRHEKSWLTNLLLFVSHAGAIIGAFYSAFAAGNYVYASIPNILGGLIGVVVGLLVLVVGGFAYWGIASALGLRLFALAAGAYAIQGASPYFTSLGLASIPNWAACFATFIAASGYIVPAVHVLFSRGLKKLVTEMSKVYDEKDQNYRNVFEHTFNILEASYLAQAVAGMTGALAVATQSVIGGVVFLLSYLFVGHLVLSQRSPRDQKENLINRESLRSASVLVSAHYGWLQGASYLASTGANGWGIGGAIGGGLLHAALCYLLLFPLAYVSIRFFLKPLAHPAIGKFLVTMYDQVVNVFDKIDEMRKDVYSSKASPMKTLVQQTVNIVVAAGAGIGTQLATVKYSLPVPELLTGLAVALSYLVIGRILTKEKIRFFGRNANGMTVLGMLTGLSTALMTGVATMKASSLTFAIILGLLVGLVTTAWLFPIAFGILAALFMTLAPRATRFASESLAAVHSFLWSKFKSFVTLFVNAYRAVRDAFKQLGKAFRESYRAIRDELDRLLGRKPKSDDKENNEDNE